MVKFILAISLVNPGARTFTIQGIPSSKMMMNMIKKNVSKDIALAAKRTDSSLPEATSLEENNGTKADVKAPSAKRLRNRLGSLNDTKKASEFLSNVKSYVENPGWQILDL